MYSHSLVRWEWSALLHVANGVTGMRDPGAVMPATEIVVRRGSVDRAKTIKPRSVASGTIVDGSPTSRATYVGIDGPDMMRTCSRISSARNASRPS